MSDPWAFWPFSIPWIFWPFLGVALIVLAAGLQNYMKIRAKKGGIRSEQFERLERRMGEVERRLGDIQEIVLSIDEQLQPVKKPDSRR